MQSVCLFLIQLQYQYHILQLNTLNLFFYENSQRIFMVLDQPLPYHGIVFRFVCGQKIGFRCLLSTANL